jgi:hypothetical protein
MMTSSMFPSQGFWGDETRLVSLLSIWQTRHCEPLAPRNDGNYAIQTSGF